MKFERNRRTTAYVATAIAAVLAVIAIFTHGGLEIGFEMAAILLWLGIGIGVAANEKRNSDASKP